MDIGKEASELVVHSLGSLEEVDKKKSIDHRWRREAAILFLSVGIIVAVLSVSVITFFLTDDDSNLDWSKQTLTALLGFAAGSIWSSSKSNGRAESEG
ncbi:hypothetical protein [Shimia sp.]|uniref:hypothetical protein n=1 Tax=Shimia sp. TaxID=1954381 RepID=UPI0025F9E083|nr:hypothetical protein [Shimia sp.]